MVFLLVEGKCPHTLGRVVVCSAAEVMHSSCQPEGMCGDLACLQALTVPWLRRFPQFVGVGYRPDIKHATSVWGEKGWDEIRPASSGWVGSKLPGDRQQQAAALQRVGVAHAGWLYHAPRVALHRVVLLRLGASALRHGLRGVVHQPGRRRAYSGKAKTTISAASRATESLSMR